MLKPWMGVLLAMPVIAISLFLFFQDVVKKLRARLPWQHFTKKEGEAELAARTTPASAEPPRSLR
jgi:hypothetical protein